MTLCIYGSRHVLLGTTNDYRTGCDPGRVDVYVNLYGRALKGKGAHSDVIRMDYGWRV